MFAGTVRRYRRYLIGLAVIVVLVGAYALAGFYALPHFARSGLQNFVASHYGRTVTVGDLRFNPFTLVFEARDVSLPDADGQPMIAFRLLRVNLAAASLWRWAPSFHAIRLEQPFVRTVIREDGAVNLADLGKGFAAQQPRPPAGPPAKLFIDQLTVSAGTAIYEDRSHPTPFRTELQPITFDLRDFSTTARTNNAYELTAASPEGERLAWNGTIEVAPVASRGHFEVTDLRAGTIGRYLHDTLPFEISSGVIGFKGSYDLKPEEHGVGLKIDVQDTEIQHLGVRPRNGHDNYVELGRVAARDTRVDVAGRTVGIGHVLVAGGDVRAWLDQQGKLNLLELMAKPAVTSPPTVLAPAPAAAGAAAPTPAATQPRTAPSSASPDQAQPDATAGAGPGAGAGARAGAGAQRAWVVSVPDINVDGVQIAVEDREVSPAVALTFKPVKAHVGGYSTAPDTVLDVKLEATINDSAALSASGKVSPSAGTLSAHSELSQLDLSTFQPYIARRTAMTLLSGQLATKLDLERTADGNFAVKGETTVTGLRSVDNELKQDFIKWKEVRVSGLEYNLKPASLTINNIVARGPYARVIIAPDRTINVKTVLSGPNGAAKPGGVTDGPAAAAEPATQADSPARRTSNGAPQRANSAPTSPAPAATPMPISIRTVQIVDGSARYSDLWIQPNFAVGILQLNGTVDGLSSDPQSRAKVTLDGKVDRYAPVNIIGDVNLLAATAYTDVRMNFKGLELTTVTPYSGHFAGYKIDKGKLSVDLHYKIDNRQLEAEHHFVIDQLQLGERVESPAAVKLPLKLAIALLKDRNGVIDVGLPISGSLDDPEFEVAPIVWKAFVHLMTRAVTAPFALLGRLFGGSEQMNYIDFAPGTAQLDTAAKEKLGTLTKALQERPHLQLDVPTAFSPDLDRAPLAARKLRAKLKGLARNENDLNDPLQHYRLLLTEFRSEAGKDAALPASVQAVESTQKTLMKGRNPPPSYDQAITDLESALTERIDVTEDDLQALGNRRAEAIEAVLLTGTNIDPARVFAIHAPPKPDSPDKVRLELSLK